MPEAARTCGHIAPSSDWNSPTNHPFTVTACTGFCACVRPVLFHGVASTLVCRLDTHFLAWLAQHLKSETELEIELALASRVAPRFIIGLAGDLARSLAEALDARLRPMVTARVTPSTTCGMPLWFEPLAVAVPAVVAATGPGRAKCRRRSFSTTTLAILLTAGHAENRLPHVPPLRAIDRRARQS